MDESPLVAVARRWHQDLYLRGRIDRPWDWRSRRRPRRSAVRPRGRLASAIILGLAAALTFFGPFLFGGRPGTPLNQPSAYDVVHLVPALIAVIAAALFLVPDVARPRAAGTVAIVAGLGMVLLQLLAPAFGGKPYVFDSNSIEFHFVPGIVAIVVGAYSLAAQRAKPALS